MQHDLTFRALTVKHVSVDVCLVSSRMITSKFNQSELQNILSPYAFHWGTLQWPIMISGILQVFWGYID